MSEPTIPPPSEEDMQIDLEYGWRLTQAHPDALTPRETVIALLRRCHAAESQLAAVTKQRDDAIREKEDMRQRNKWLRDRWDLTGEQMRKRERYAVLERMDAAERQRDDLLAIIFRDGGQRAAELGDRAVEEAHKEWAAVVSQLDELNDRWQRAVGMPLEQAEHLASVASIEGKS